MNYYYGDDGEFNAHCCVTAYYGGDCQHTLHDDCHFHGDQHLQGQCLRSRWSNFIYKHRWLDLADLRNPLRYLDLRLSDLYQALSYRVHYQHSPLFPRAAARWLMLRIGRFQEIVAKWRHPIPDGEIPF